MFFLFFLKKPTNAQVVISQKLLSAHLTDLFCCVWPLAVCQSSKSDFTPLGVKKIETLFVEEDCKISIPFFINCVKDKTICKID